MIQDQIDQIETKLRNAGGLTPEAKSELLELVSILKTEVEQLSKTNEDEAHSVAGFAAASAHEATRSEKNPELLDSAVRGLTTSVVGMETSHPELASAVNRIATALSNMGI